MERIWLSVIIPVYNVENYLEECLDSVLAQGMQDIEIICVNDGSTDGSADILRKYTENDSGIIVIEQENQGLSVARNTGIKNAKGEYLIFLDSDDMLVSGALNKIKEVIISEDIELLCFDAKAMYETEELRQTHNKDYYLKRSAKYGGIKTGRQLFCEFIENDEYIVAAWIYCIKRKWLMEYSIYFEPGILYEDCPFSFLCLMTAHKSMYKDIDTVIYRIRNNSIMTSGYQVKHLKSYLKCLEIIAKYIVNNEFDEREQSVILSYWRKLIQYVRDINYRVGEVSLSKIDDLCMMSKMFANAAGVGGYSEFNVDEDLYLRGFRNLIAEYDRVILYGAGKIGKMVYGYLKSYRLEEKVESFAVTELEREYMIEDIFVKRLSDMSRGEKVMVIVTAGIEVQDKMYEYAKGQGFSNVKKIDFHLQRMLENYMGRM